MARPPQQAQLLNRDHVCTWVNGRGHTRGLYAQGRGQFVQARISGYSYRTRHWFAPDWLTLGWMVQRIVLGWGPGWRLKGQNLIRHMCAPHLNPRNIIEARAGQ